MPTHTGHRTHATDAAQESIGHVGSQAALGAQLGWFSISQVLPWSGLSPPLPPEADPAQVTLLGWSDTQELHYLKSSNGFSLSLSPW